MNVILILVYGNYRYEDFLNQLNSKGIKKEKMKDFYLWLITYYGETNKEIIPYSIKFLCSDKSDSNIEDIVNILNQLKNNLNALLSYFNSQNIIQKVIKEENDFKKSNLTSNFKFLKLLVENGFFEENMRNKLKNTNYYHKTLSISNEILNKLQTLNFDYNETLVFEKIKDKLIIICFNDFDKANEIFVKVENIIDNFIELKKILIQLKNILKIFLKKIKK